jgi:hypothetical protein
MSFLVELRWRPIDNERIHAQYDEVPRNVKLFGTGLSDTAYPGTD